MSQFFKFLFASCLGTALALILLFFIGFSAIAGLASKAGDKPVANVKPNSVLELKFNAQVPEKTNNLAMDPFDIEQKDVLGLSDMVLAIKKAKEDPDIKGIYLNASFVGAGKATSSVLRAALEDFKTSGKFIVSYANYYTQNAYYLASVSDSVLLNPVGGVDFRGLSTVIAYYKGLLDKLDVQMKIFYAGKFKSATEPLRMEKMSDENRLQVREYLTALNDIMMRDVAASRHMPESELRTIADNFEGRGAELALKARLIDRIAYEDEAFDLMKNKIGIDKKEKLSRVSVEDYFKSRVKKIDLSAKDKIAIVYAEGTIRDGDNGEPGDVYDGKYVKLLRKIRQDDNVKAIVLRINSPGGSVTAGLAIYDTIQFMTCDVNTYCIGMAASMGAVLLAAGTKGKRYALPNSDIMIHQVSGGAQGTASDVERTVEFMFKLKKRLIAILAKHTGKNEDQVKTDSDRDYYMTADEAKAYGLVDEVVKSRKDLKVAGEIAENAGGAGTKSEGIDK